MLLFDVECPNGHKNEVFLKNDERQAPCPQCNEVANRIISPVRSNLDVCSGDFPGATAKWLKGREKQMARERKAKAENGPDYYK